MPLHMINRREWGAKYWNRWSKKMLRPLYHPVRYVLLYYHSYLKACEKDLKCKGLMKVVQKYHIQVMNYPDIAYNFVIANDDLVYEGRGWATEPQIMSEKYVQYNGQSLDIAYLGDFREGAPDGMHENFHQLVELGIKFKYIHDSPDLIEINEQIIMYTNFKVSLKNFYEF